jgi:hypothetical protein
MTTSIKELRDVAEALLKALPLQILVTGLATAAWMAQLRLEPEKLPLM